MGPVKRWRRQWMTTIGGGAGELAWEREDGELILGVIMWRIRTISKLRDLAIIMKNFIPLFWL